MRTRGIPPDEVLAIARLRQWRADRSIMRSGKTVTLQREGYTPRSSARFDARQVRVIDFERALSMLTKDEQTILLMSYGDRQDQPDTAEILGCSTRKVSYTLPPARKRLASILDKLDLL
jgi:DNA-directed RNA polymerase specialized sigma24 family protein